MKKETRQVKKASAETEAPELRSTLFSTSTAETSLFFLISKETPPTYPQSREQDELQALCRTGNVAQCSLDARCTVSLSLAERGGERKRTLVRTRRAEARIRVAPVESETCI
jgi:hypothetical protein